MGDNIRWGIIGPGRIAHKFADAMRVVKGARLQAVASRNRERARAFADRHRIPKTYESYEALVADPEIDAVYIATPHRFHAEQVRLCLEADKHVLCEKPFTVNAAEAELLFDLARRKRRFLMEALWTRFLPIYAQVRRWLEEERIGALRWIEGSIGFRAERDPNDRLWNPHLPGGALLDMGVYPIAIAQWTLKRNPTSFAVEGWLGETGVDEQTAAVLRYDNDCTALVSASLLTAPRVEFAIHGSEGSILIHRPFYAAVKATLSVGEKSQTVKRPHRRNGFEYQIDESNRCIREGRLESPHMPHADTLANMRLMDAMRERLGLRYPFEHIHSASDDQRRPK